MRAGQGEPPCRAVWRTVRTLTDSPMPHVLLQDPQVPHALTWQLRACGQVDLYNKLKLSFNLLFFLFRFFFLNLLFLCFDWIFPFLCEP